MCRKYAHLVAILAETLPRKLPSDCRSSMHSRGWKLTQWALNCCDKWVQLNRAFWEHGTKETGSAIYSTLPLLVHIPISTYLVWPDHVTSEDTHRCRVQECGQPIDQACRKLFLLLEVAYRLSNKAMHPRTNCGWFLLELVIKSTLSG